MKFVLVHGTLSSNRTWESFEAELREQDPSLRISHWQWSGANAQGRRKRSTHSALDPRSSANSDTAQLLFGLTPPTTWHYDTIG
jgi:hypothetical protein